MTSSNKLTVRRRIEILEGVDKSKRTRLIEMMEAANIVGHDRIRMIEDLDKQTGTRAVLIDYALSLEGAYTIAREVGHAVDESTNEAMVRVALEAIGEDYGALEAAVESAEADPTPG